MLSGVGNSHVNPIFHPTRHCSHRVKSGTWLARKFPTSGYVMLSTSRYVTILGAGKFLDAQIFLTPHKPLNVPSSSHLNFIRWFDQNVSSRFFNVLRFVGLDDILRKTEHSRCSWPGIWSCVVSPEDSHVSCWAWICGLLSVFFLCDLRWVNFHAIHI